MATQDLGKMEFDTQTSMIDNIDLISLISMLDLGLQQLSRCPSATMTRILPADVLIVKGWMKRFKQYFTLYSSVPPVYLPKASPKGSSLPTPPDINIVQNPIIQYLMNSMNHMRTELIYCESAELLSGISKPEQDIVISPWIAKFEGVIAEMEVNLSDDNSDATFLPDADLQEAGVNPGEPR